MTSNEDLMEFLRKMEEKRAVDREADRQELKERQEDKEEIIKVIDECLGEKVAEATAPIREQTEAVVKAQSQMKEQVELLMGEMKAVKEKLNSGGSDTRTSSNGLTMAEVISSSSRTGQDRQTVREDGFGRQDPELGTIISLARRTVGLHKIDQADLVRMRQEQYGGAKSEEEEKLLAVKEYLKLELKLDRTTLERMDIERIFFPAKEDPQCLYVTFKHVASVAKIYQKTFIMRKESRIITYIPKQFYNRFRTISEFEYNLREEEKCRTRIKMGLRDLQLFRKDGPGGKWELVSLPTGLPPVELNSSSSLAESGSPAPGRPGQSVAEKRNRDSTGSSTEDNTPKVARKESEVNDSEIVKGKEGDRLDREAWRESLEAANLVGEATISPGKEGGLQRRLDLGAVMSITGTPIKPNSQDQIGSPIFSNPARKLTNLVK